MLEMHFSVSFRYILPLKPYPEEKKHKLKWNSECTALFHVFLFRNVDMFIDVGGSYVCIGSIAKLSTFTDSYCQKSR